MTGGRKTCKYYAACGSRENCARCDGYSKAEPDTVGEALATLSDYAPLAQ